MSHQGQCSFLQPHHIQQLQPAAAAPQPEGLKGLRQQQEQGCSSQPAAPLPSHAAEGVPEAAMPDWLHGMPGAAAGAQSTGDRGPQAPAGSQDAAPPQPAAQDPGQESDIVVQPACQGTPRLLCS